MKRKKPSLPEEPVKLRIHKGDTVEVISGKDKGKRGVVLKALPKTNRLEVEGVNVAIRHTKQRTARLPDSDGQPRMIPGGRIEMNNALHASKVMLVCPHCSKPTRVGYAFREGEEKASRRKYRVCKHPECGKNMDQK